MSRATSAGTSREGRRSLSWADAEHDADDDVHDDGADNDDVHDDG
jgi:hypothetical protein